MIRFAISTVLLFATVLPVVAQQQLTPEHTKFFETKIRPVLIKECYGCHSSKSGNAKGGLRLDNQRLMQLGGDSGPGVVANDLDESLIYNAITHEDFVMPPKRKLSVAVIKDFRTWIEMGAPDPRVTEVAEIRSTISKEDVAAAKENFWAYKPPTQPPIPSVQDAGWPKTDIDRFVLSKLEQSNLAPSKDAESYKILRRLCFDLVGLPPSPEQIQYFEKQWKKNPDQAVAFVVDRLIDKEQFGERWGRHWLDVARYAESTGREVNMTYPHAWRYRDYVIDSFNDDKPFNEFVQEQIAGDLLPIKNDDEWQENLIATGFLAMGTKNVNENNGRQFAADLIDEQIDTTTRVFLGTSVACARCHDHKFDAIPQSDYYALAGIFQSTRTYFGNPPSKFGSLGDLQTKRKSSLILLPVAESNVIGETFTPQQIQEMEAEVRDLREQMAASRRDRMKGGSAKNAIASAARSASKSAQLSAKLATVDEAGNPRSYCMGVQENDSPSNARLMVRGDIDEPGQLVQRGFPQVLTDTKVVVPSRKSGRLELARFIGSSENPLTARVMVNRVWQHMIGQGIVTTTENFGVTGASPSNQALLDYLAVKFVESGWSVKSLIREIAKSHVYRISSEYNERMFEYDPENALVWRANTRRLDAEALRDAMLMISGEIDFDRPHGSDVAKAGFVRVRNGRIEDTRESVKQIAMKVGATSREDFQRKMREGRAAGQGGGFQRGAFRGRGPTGGSTQSAREKIESLMSKKPLDVEDAKYRSVYMPIVRDEVPRSLYVFDFAESSMVIGTREKSNTPNQALYMMNNPFVIEKSESFAKRLATDYRTSADRISNAFLVAYGRPPTSGERSATAKFISTFGNSRDRSGANTLVALCQSLFAAAEFRYVD